GAIQALTGGYSFDLTKYNRAIQAKRQPGSNFKPFLYLSALEQGRTAATLYNDAPIVFDDIDLETTWRPQNSSGQFEGPTRLRVALYTSRNLVSIRLLRDIGIQTTLDYLKKLKIPTDTMPNNLSLALGSGALSPMEVARGFAVIANGGYDVTPYLIESIRNSNNELLYKAPDVILCDTDCDAKPATAKTPSGLSPEIQPAPRIAKRLADPQAVYIMHSILRDVITKGTGQRARALDRPDLGGKTGTTNEQRDTWFSGFNNDISATAWVGFDQPAPLGRGEYGSTAALPVWMEYMKTALKDQPIAYMPQPNGIVSVRIDPATGKRARPSQTDGVFELFREGNAPPPLETGTTAKAPKDDSGDNLSQELF
ncbi:MAG: penicillin-binding transpeptidase domain-containing protein, partial [Marinobacter sp.]|nr:penicillin-binding transpeptidase domain-containing protein [Marinobacter sp.]